MWRVAEWLLKRFPHSGRTYFVVEHPETDRVVILKVTSSLMLAVKNGLPLISTRWL